MDREERRQKQKIKQLESGKLTDITNSEDLKLHQKPLPRLTAGRLRTIQFALQEPSKSQQSLSSINLWNWDRINEEEETAEIWRIRVQVF